MSSKHYRELVIDNGVPPLYGDLLTVPKDCVFWRGYNVNYPAISNRPAFFGSKKTASAYSNPTLGCFTNKKELKLMDIHFMKVILRQLLDEIKMKREYNIDKSIPSKDEILCTDCITISFGICSLAHQIAVMNKLYKDIPNFTPLAKMKEYYNTMKYTAIEQSGFRVGETTVDGVSMYFLRDFFKGYADGFFSPTLPSPFHIERGGVLHPEIIIFNPIESGVELLNKIPPIMDSLDITDLFLSIRKVALVRSSQFEMKGGENNNDIVHPIENFNTQIEMKNKKAVSIAKLGEKYGKLWRNKYFYAVETEAPVPTCKANELLMRIYEAQNERLGSNQNNGK